MKTETMTTWRGPSTEEIDGDLILSALFAALNVEGAASAAAHFLGAYRGLDVPAHYAKVREAIIHRTIEIRLAPLFLEGGAS